MADFNGEKFYRDKTWELVMNELQDVKREQMRQAQMLADIKSKIGYIYGFAAAIGLIVSFVVEFIKSKFAQN